MIKESLYLFLLIGGNPEYNTQYVGKIQSCFDAEKIVKKYENKRNDVKGYLCLDTATARKSFTVSPNPAEKKIIKDIKQILPKPIAKPKFD